MPMLQVVAAVESVRAVVEFLLRGSAQVLAWAHHEKPHKKVDSTDYASWKSPVVRSLTGAAGMPLVGTCARCC